jgi:hypothetical protein
LAAATGTVGNGSIAHPSLSPDGGRIAYQKKTAQGWRIYVSRVDGAQERAITSGPGNDVEPSWRSDGQLIAFASNRTKNYDLFAIHPDGTSLRQLTRTGIDERSPQWSPRPFALLKPSDITTNTVIGRSKNNLAPTDLQLLQMLAKNATSWESYKYKFDIKPFARYYKLLFTEGSGDKRQIATMRDNSSYRQTLSTGMRGAHSNACWNRAANFIAFTHRTGNTQSIYTAEYPRTSDVNEGYGKVNYGVTLKEWRTSIRRIGTVGSTEAHLSWTPNSEYVAAASGRTMQLLPFQGGENILIAKTAPMASHGFTWLRDARTALVTVNAGQSTRLQKIALTTPLLDVVNLNDFSGYLNARDRTFLTRNSFVATGSPRRQMYHAYEETDYENLPIFVTTDSLLHLNHLVFDYLLRGVETDHLMPAVIALCDHYLRTSLEQAKNAASPAVADAARSNAAFFAVASRLALGAIKTGEITVGPKPPADDPLATDRAMLRARSIQKQQVLLNKWAVPLQATLKTLPADIKPLVDAELSLVKGHQGLSESPIFGGRLTGVGDVAVPLLDTRIDYSDFIPRGHYSRSEILRRYFLTTRWLSAGPFRATPQGARQSLLIMAATDDKIRARYNKVIKVMSVFVGDGDDQDMSSYAAPSRSVFGGVPTPNQLIDDTKVAAFVELVEKLPRPLIAPSRGSAFRFLPQLYTLDAEIMQQLVYDRNPPDVGTENQPRYFALGLDVMGVLGSQRAREILDRTQFQGAFFDFGLKETQYEDYGERFTELSRRFGAMPTAQWNRNLYTRTLHSLLPLLQVKPANRFKFTQSPAWVDKNLNTALATWAELKHDTMPKMPVAIEAGGEGGISETPIWEQPVGVVEPTPEVYRRLSALVATERQVLAEAGYLSPAVKERVDAFAALLTMVQKLEKKQSAGQAFTPREIEQLRFYGAYQDHLTLVTAEGEGGSMEGSDMAIIADVSTAYSTVLKQQLVLQEGVGRALPIYVAVERNGRRELARGAVFTYYEFTHPAADRLTDEEWRELLDSEKAPKPPTWTSSYVSRTTDE